MITVIRNNFTVRTFRIGENDFLLGLNMAQLGSIELFNSLQYGLLSFLRRHLWNNQEINQVNKKY